MHDVIKPWHVLLSLTVLAAGLIITGRNWIINLAQSAVTDGKFLGTLPGRVRPTCIFNTRESIEDDHGTQEYIQKIDAKPLPQFYGYEVVIHAKRHLVYAPLVTGLDVSLFP